MVRGGLISVLLAAMSVAGCSGAPEPVAETPEPDAAVFDPATPAVLGATNGLEMRVWVVEDQDDVLAEAIARYEASPTPMLDSVRTAWKASGLRVIQVPIDDLGELRGRLRLVGPEQRDWFGRSPDWSEAIRGREIAAGTVLQLADGLMRAPAGRLRVLMRCWPTPGESITRPAMHVDLAVQLERRRISESVLELPAMASELEAGVVFPRLRSTMSVPAGVALVVIPMPESAMPAGIEGAAQAGPPVPITPTLGEAMLSSAVPGTIEPVRRRAIVTLLPRLPDRFRLSAAPDLPRR